MKVDAIISYVNPNDSNWVELYKTYCNESNEEYKENRFRDTSFLKYVLRSIAKYMQWINNVYLVVQSESQIPEWINRDTVKIVLHEDFIPGEFLPTFNCNTIESFMHKIPGLSDYFIYFNDDMILNNKCYKTDFYIYDKYNLLPLKQKIDIGKNSWYNCLLNDKTEVNKLLGIIEDDNIWYKFSHTITPLYKPLCDECFNKLKDEIYNRITRFRELNNFNQHLYAYYIYKTGRSNSIQVPVAYINMNKYNKTILQIPIKTVCINDIVKENDNIIIENRKLYINDLEKKFSDKCKYEK